MRNSDVDNILRLVHTSQKTQRLFKKTSRLMLLGVNSHWLLNVSCETRIV
jgi:hypothetical protein